MRLINTLTLELEEFCREEIPEYAILSHTWGRPKDEVNLEDMRSGEFRHKAAYQKIQYLCHQANQDQLSWAWCDTCCINQDSSAELSEAINSMFRWYQNAKICYAYISDVVSSGIHYTGKLNVGVPDASKRWTGGTKGEFRASRWFSRGWTLQELLALGDIVFFAQDWTVIGLKRDLCYLICDITGISYGALKCPWTITSYSIATRMSWAARRQTSRPEDRAYSLLGILGVHIPLIYGEAHNAFRRLQTELIKFSDDESIFVHSGSNILADSPDVFVSSSFEYNMAAPLPRSPEDNPYSITNLGLKIDVRLYRVADQGSQLLLGVLNCHHIDDYSHYLAIPLQETSVRGTLLRAPGPIKQVAESSAKSLEKSSILIRLEPPERCDISYLLRRRGFGHLRFNEYVETFSTPAQRFVWNHLTMYLDPEIRSTYRIVFHKFLGDSDDGSFFITTIFELPSNTGGLLLSTFRKHEALRRAGSDAVYLEWEKSGKPFQGELVIINRRMESMVIMASITQEILMSHPVWVLSIELKPGRSGG